MSDNIYDEEKHMSQLRAWGLWQMLRGAGWAMLVFVAIIAVAVILLLIKALLPVNPNAALETLAALVAIV